LRVYSISDQDDAGHWIRREFPELFYIVNPSTQDGEEYRSATWTGISGDKYYRNAPGADFTTVSNSWLDEHVRNKGSLGETYPQYLFIMEGDTPAFFGLIDNGLASYRNPGWGGWGGATSSDSPRESHGLYGLKEEIVSREAQTLEIPRSARMDRATHRIRQRSGGGEKRSSMTFQPGWTGPRRISRMQIIIRLLS
jgi:Protein of unknown function (DUF1593)